MIFGIKSEPLCPSWAVFQLTYWTKNSLMSLNGFVWSNFVINMSTFFTTVGQNYKWNRCSMIQQKVSVPYLFHSHQQYTKKLLHIKSHNVLGLLCEMIHESSDLTGVRKPVRKNVLYIFKIKGWTTVHTNERSTPTWRNNKERKHFLVDKSPSSLNLNECIKKINICRE